MRCPTDRADLCRAGPVIGFDLPGCIADRARLPALALAKVDDRISDREAACLQSPSDRAAAGAAGLRMACTVAALGQASWGLELLPVARLGGAGLVIAVDVRRGSCQVSREIGADVVFACAGGSPKQVRRDMAGRFSLDGRPVSGYSSHHRRPLITRPPSATPPP